MANGIKTGGRTKGTPNRTTAETKELLQKVVTNELDNLTESLESLTPKERLDVVIKLLPYLLPKQQEIAIESTQPPFQSITVEIVQPDEVKRIVKELENKY
jgi:prophage DNA circulation protein